MLLSLSVNRLFSSQSSRRRRNRRAAAAQVEQTEPRRCLSATAIADPGIDEAIEDEFVDFDAVWFDDADYAYADLSYDWFPDFDDSEFEFSGDDDTDWIVSDWTESEGWYEYDTWTDAEWVDDGWFSLEEDGYDVDDNWFEFDVVSYDWSDDSFGFDTEWLWYEDYAWAADDDFWSFGDDALVPDEDLEYPFGNDALIPDEDLVLFDEFAFDVFESFEYEYVDVFTDAHAMDEGIIFDIGDGFTCELFFLDEVAVEDILLADELSPGDGTAFDIDLFDAEFGNGEVIIEQVVFEDEFVFVDFATFEDDTFFQDEFVDVGAFEDDSFFEVVFVEVATFEDGAFFGDEFVDFIGSDDDTLFEVVFVEVATFEDDTFFEDVFVEVVGFEDDAFFDVVFVDIAAFEGEAFLDNVFVDIVGFDDNAFFEDGFVDVVDQPGLEFFDSIETPAITVDSGLSDIGGTDALSGDFIAEFGDSISESFVDGFTFDTESIDEFSGDFGADPIQSDNSFGSEISDGGLKGDSEPIDAKAVVFDTSFDIQGGLGEFVDDTGGLAEFTTADDAKAVGGSDAFALNGSVDITPASFAGLGISEAGDSAVDAREVGRNGRTGRTASEVDNPIRAEAGSGSLAALARRQRDSGRGDRAQPSRRSVDSVLAHRLHAHAQKRHVTAAGENTQPGTERSVPLVSQSPQRAQQLLTQQSSDAVTAQQRSARSRFDFRMSRAAAQASRLTTQPRSASRDVSYDATLLAFEHPALSMQLDGLSMPTHDHDHAGDSEIHEGQPGYAQMVSAAGTIAITGAAGVHFTQRRGWSMLLRFVRALLGRI